MTAPWWWACVEGEFLTEDAVEAAKHEHVCVRHTLPPAIAAALREREGLSVALAKRTQQLSSREHGLTDKGRVSRGDAMSLNEHMECIRRHIREFPEVCTEDFYKDVDDLLETVSINASVLPLAPVAPKAERCALPAPSRYSEEVCELPPGHDGKHSWSAPAPVPGGECWACGHLSHKGRACDAESCCCSHDGRHEPEQRGGRSAGATGKDCPQCGSLTRAYGWHKRRCLACNWDSAAAAPAGGEKGKA